MLEYAVRVLTKRIISIYINRRYHSMVEIFAQRQFSSFYIWFDIAFLCVFAALLIYRKKYMALLAGIFASALYMAVDFGMFYSVLGTRVVTGGSPFWILLWLSFSYGLTNMAVIWLWLDKDKHIKEWLVMILAWWFALPIITTCFPNAGFTITLSRGTGQYHGLMGAIMFVGYLCLIIYNLYQKDKEKRAPIIWILIIGILIQVGWESALLVGGIRSYAIDDFGLKIKTLIVNSLVETNIGMPYFWFFFIAWTAKVTDRLTPRKNKLKIVDRIKENNAQRCNSEIDVYEADR